MDTQRLSGGDIRISLDLSELSAGFVLVPGYALVDRHVLQKMRFLSERFGAVLAAEGFLSGVRA